MALEQKYTGRSCSMPVGLAWGAMVGAGTTALLAVLLAKLIDLGKLQWENVGYGIMCLLVLASFLGAITSYGKIKRQRLLVCILSGAIYWGMMLSVTMLCFGGQFEAVGPTALLIFAGSGAAGMIGLWQGGGQKGRNRMLRNR